MQLIRSHSNCAFRSPARSGSIASRIRPGRVVWGRLRRLRRLRSLLSLAGLVAVQIDTGASKIIPRVPQGDPKEPKRGWKGSKVVPGGPTGTHVFFPKATSEGFSFSRSTAGSEMSFPPASGHHPDTVRTPSAHHPDNRFSNSICDSDGCFNRGSGGGVRGCSQGWPRVPQGSPGWP